MEQESHIEQPVLSKVEGKQHGGQPGNQNARKHGFYSKTLSPEVQQKVYSAAEVEGLDQEIALLRARISVAAEDPAQSGFLISGISLLSRLLTSREKLGYQKQNSLQQAVVNILNDIPPQIARSITHIIEKEGSVTNSKDDSSEGPKTNPNECPICPENEVI